MLTRVAVQSGKVSSRAMLVQNMLQFDATHLLLSLS